MARKNRFRGRVLGVLLACSSALGNIGATDHLMYSLVSDTDDPSRSKNLLMHGMQVRADALPYQMGIEFANRRSVDNRFDLNRNFVLEKETISAHWKSMALTVGDSHQTFGRGVALDLYRDPVFGIDNTVEGAALQLTQAQQNALVFAGRIHSLKIPVAQQPLSDPLTNREVLIAGGALESRVAPETKVGGHYFYALNRSLDSTRIDKNWNTLGVLAEKTNLFDGVDVYAESNMLFTRLLLRPQSLPTAHGSYGALSWTDAPWKFVTEIKDYRNYQFDFRRPPTLEEDIVETLNIIDISASRVQIEHRDMETKVSRYGSYLFGRDRIENTDLHHGVLGTRFPVVDRLELDLKGGYRTMPGVNRLVHAMVKSKLKTFKGQSLELGVRKQVNQTSLSFLPTTENRNLADLTYVFSENLTLSVGYEFLPNREVEEGRNFMNASLLWKMGALTARAFGGKTSGGTQCSGGICRRIPPFSGGMVETVYVF